MRKIVSIALISVALSLGGCATAPPPYGNFIRSVALDQRKIAADAAQQLATLYAPAHTRLELQQPATDPFGQALVKSLRDRGYALLEQTLGAGAAAPGGLPLRYVFDQVGDSNLYYLTLMVGNRSISRPYLAQNGTFASAGYWVRKE